MGDKSMRIQETLSAMMDNEATELDTRRVLRELDEDGELRSAWHRYHLASSAMHRELPPRIVDLSARISAAIADEQAPSSTFSRFLQPLSKVAVAATVAAVAVLGVQQLQLAGVPGTGSAQQVASTLPVAPQAERDSSATSGPQFQLPAGFDLPPVAGRVASTESKYAVEPRPVTIMQQVPQAQPDRETQLEIQAYLNSMMKRHTEKASSSASQGMLPYARLPQEINNAP